MEVSFFDDIFNFFYTSLDLIIKAVSRYCLWIIKSKAAQNRSKISID
ncbi:hypothetical protein BN938_0266 [Mucinivorans hirudinis]|uniref:Uncharacterized protein n=1 Tax=Mucinivorans hirudinis TaxID=1433126 RepID=A0A060R667_9BACT|nr:hypothetical protein BN938_0266 [Mucinivorans hirudinis]